VCQQCCNLKPSTLTPKNQKSPLSPRPVDTWSVASNGFDSRHKDIVDSISALKITSDNLSVRTQCDCGYSNEASCHNYRTTTVNKSLSTAESVAVVFGHVVCDSRAAFTPINVGGVGLGVDSVPSLGAMYEICIVDTRHQLLCRLSSASADELTGGVAGQHYYVNASHACSLSAMPAVHATEVVASADVSSAPVVQTTFEAVDTSMTNNLALVPPRQASCFVCSTLLDIHEFPDNGRISHQNVYLPAHKAWAHNLCTLPCETKRFGVCLGRCPRLNTMVSTVFDASPRFENVCPPCLVATPPPGKTVPPHHHTHTAHAAPHATTKRPLAKHKNWLSDASALRKKAAINAANSKFSPAEIRARGAALAWSEDKSGVRHNRENQTWYTVDKKGENPSPVCGMPYWDPEFNAIRVWNTLSERAQAIASRNHLLEMGDM
jgi:hypothetical protein